MNPYETLGVAPGADAWAISRAYRKLSKRFHPDRNPGDAEAAIRYAAVDAAYRLLTDDARRAAYDRDGTTDEPRPGPAGDPLQAELLAGVAQFLMAAIQKAEGPMRPGAANVDLVAEMRSAVAGEIAAAERYRGDAERGRKTLEEAAKRFRVAAGAENYPARILRDKLTAVAADLVRVQGDLDRLTRLKTYLAGVTYEFRGPPPDPFGTWRMISTGAG